MVHILMLLWQHSWFLVLVERKSNFFMVRAVQSEIPKNILDRFECIICKETIQTPVEVRTFCDSVVGCKECIQTWNSNHSGCPKCRSEDDFIPIFVLKVLGKNALQARFFPRKLSEQHL